MNKNTKFLIGVACMSLGLTACTDDYFDQEAYNNLVTQAFPVDNVDPNHTWAMFGTATANISVNGDYGKTYRVAVYQENPLTTSPVTLLASAMVTTGQKSTLRFSYPLISPTVYVTAYDEHNHRVVQGAQIEGDGTLEVNFFGEPVKAARWGGIDTRAVSNPNLGVSDYSQYIEAKEPKKSASDFINPSWVSHDSVNLNTINTSSDFKAMTESAIRDNSVNNDNRSKKWWRIDSKTTISSGFNLNGDQNTLNKAVIYVQGTLNLQYNPNGVTFIVGGGGTLNIRDNDIYMSQASRIVVMAGGTLNIAQGRKLQLGNNEQSVGLFNAGTVTVNGTLAGGNTKGAMLYNIGTMTVNNMESMRYVFNFGELTFKNNIELPNNTDACPATTNGYMFYNEGTCTVKELKSGFTVNYGTLNGTKLTVTDHKYFNAGESEFTKLEVKWIRNFGKLTAEENVQTNDRETVNACYLHYTKSMTEQTAFKTLKMLRSSRLIIDGDMYLQDANAVMEHQSMIEVAGKFGMPQNLNFSIYGPSAEGEFAVIKIGGNLKVTKWSEFRSYNNIYYDWAKISDCYNSVEIQNLENIDGDGSKKKNVDALMNKQMRLFVPEAEATPNITIPAGDCTGTGYNTDDDDDLDNPDEITLGYRFCFEDNFPTPGDYDFNDCVIKVTPVIEGTTVTVTVSLDAVGATKQIAAAMRIVGLTENNITNVTATANLNEGLPSTANLFIPANTFKSNNVFTVPAHKKFGNAKEGINDVVIRLFDDAHWTLSNITQQSGEVKRYMYNTIRNGNAELEAQYSTFDPAETVFTFKLDTEEHAQLFVQENLDVFIVERHGVNYWEVHTVPFKDNQILADYASSTKFIPYRDTLHFPWAICAPGSFRYPIEWQSICGSKLNMTSEYGYEDNEVPYLYFVDWAQNAESNTDWYTKGINTDLIY